MSNMIQTQIMQHHGVPVRVMQLIRNMPGHIVVHFDKVLQPLADVDISMDPTETKKLVVPSARSKTWGNSFNQVSSPYMTIFPVPFAFICASHVSCVVKVEEVSDSAKLRMASRNDGVEPVVMALILGMVMVGELAWAVKGKAVPSLIRL